MASWRRVRPCCAGARHQRHSSWNGSAKPAFALSHIAHALCKFPPHETCEFTGNDGKINALTAEESEKHIKYIDLLANAVILDNTFQLSKVLKELIEEGWSISRDELTMLSPYVTHHIKRFGNYVMDLETLPEPIEDNLPLPV